MTPKNIHKIFILRFSFLKNPKSIEILNFEPKKLAWAYVWKYQSTPLPSSPHPTGGQTDRQTSKMKSLPSSQIWNFKHLFLFGISHKSACLLLLPDQRSFGLIRHMFPNYSRLFDPNCKLIFFKYQWLAPCRCEIPWKSSLIKVNRFIKDLNLFFVKEVGFCPPCQIKQWAFVQWDIVKWAFVLVGFCPFPVICGCSSGINMQLSVPCMS